MKEMTRDEQIERLKELGVVGFMDDPGLLRAVLIDTLEEKQALEIVLTSARAGEERLQADHARMEWLQKYLGDCRTMGISPVLERNALSFPCLRTWIDTCRLKTAVFDQEAERV